MPDLIIKPEDTVGNKLILQDQAGGAVLTTADSGATIANSTLTTPTIANMANCTFPAGHVIGSGVKLLSGGTYNTNSTSRTVVVNYEPVTQVEVGDTIHFGYSGWCRTYYNVGAHVDRSGEVQLWYNTVTASAGATPTGTMMSQTRGGRVSGTGHTTEDNDSYWPFNIQAAFVATATTHYCGLSVNTRHANIRTSVHASSSEHLCFYYNILKGNRVL